MTLGGRNSKAPYVRRRQSQLVPSWSLSPYPRSKVYSKQNKVRVLGCGSGGDKLGNMVVDGVRGSEYFLSCDSLLFFKDGDVKGGAGTLLWAHLCVPAQLA